MKSRFEVFMTAGYEAGRLRDVEGALRAWHVAAQIQPLCVLPHLEMGKIFAKSRRFPEAENAFARAVMLGPRRKAARFKLGLVQFALGRSDVAAMTWQPILAAKRASATRFFVKGFAALDTGDLGAALKQFEAGLSSIPCDEDTNSKIVEIVFAVRFVTTLGLLEVKRGERSAAARTGLSSALQGQGLIH